MWKRAVWKEGNQREEEGVVPCSWIDEGNQTLFWPQGVNAEDALKAQQHPDRKSWRRFQLVKVKLSSDNYEECDRYDYTSTIDTEDSGYSDHGESFLRRKRKHAQKDIPLDFVNSQDLQLLQEYTPSKLPKRTPPSTPAPAPPQKLPLPPPQTVASTSSLSPTSSSSPLLRTSSDFLRKAVADLHFKESEILLSMTVLGNIIRHMPGTAGTLENYRAARALKNITAQITENARAARALKNITAQITENVRAARALKNITAQITENARAARALKNMMAGTTENGRATRSHEDVITTRTAENARAVRTLENMTAGTPKNSRAAGTLEKGMTVGTHEDVMAARTNITTTGLTWMKVPKCSLNLNLAVSL